MRIMLDHIKMLYDKVEFETLSKSAMDNNIRAIIIVSRDKQSFESNRVSIDKH